jgi:hypothetical protein
VDSVGVQINTHQYSVTHFERDLMKGTGEEDKQGVYTHHGIAGAPGTWLEVMSRGKCVLSPCAGAFFNFEISPILVVHSETRQSFAHFLTS